MGNMKKIIAFLGMGFMISCYSTRFNETDNDPSLAFYTNDKGSIFLSSNSGNSAEITLLKKYKYEGDTLIITKYKRCVFCSNKNIQPLPLKDNIKYLKCANKLYKVEITENQYNLIELK
jgi:hypothetical protein